MIDSRLVEVNKKDKENMADIAIKHAEEMAGYPQGESRVYQTEECEVLGGNGITIDDKLPDPKPQSGSTNVQLLDADTVTALFMEKSLEKPGTVCVLNFASYKFPGGGYMLGALAQEESLCHESNLYNVLSGQEEFYSWNREHTNKGLYMNRAIYSKNVVFTKGSNLVKADVLTCAAPNRSEGFKYESITEQDNAKALKARIRFIYNVLVQEKADSVILGAFGCGAFRQDARAVASMFMDEMRYTPIRRFIYAVPKGPSKDNYDAFFETIYGMLKGA